MATDKESKYMVVLHLYHQQAQPEYDDDPFKKYEKFGGGRRGKSGFLLFPPIPWTAAESSKGHR